MSETATGTDWMARIDALRDLVEQEGPISEEQGTLTAPLVRALVASGLFGMQIPAELGGGGAGLLDVVETTEELVYHNASAGWNVMAVSVGSGNIAALIDDDDVARRIFGSDPLPRVAVYGAPVGTATPVDGGYTLSGSFQFASGIAQATWVMVSAPDPRAEHAPGRPSLRGFLVPIEQVVRLGGWEVYGLEATASEDFDVADVFVPDEHTFSLSDTDDFPKRGQAFRRLGVVPVSLVGNVGVPLGLARRALEEVRRLSLRKARPGQPRVAEQQMFRHDFGFHDAAVRSARAFTREVLIAGERAAEQDAVTPLHVQRISQASIYVHRVGAEAVRFAYEWAGTNALRRPGRLGRLLLDMSAASQHQANDVNLMADAGQVLIESSPADR